VPKHVALFLCLISFGCGDPQPPPGALQTARPHIVLITADALRPDHLSVNGYARQTSPAIDAFASHAWNFSEAVTVIPKTGPAFATMFSGRHPAEHGVRSNLHSVSNSTQMLAQILKQNGYRTAAFVGNPVLQPQLGYDRGFDKYQVLPSADGVVTVEESFLPWARAGWDRPTFAWIHFLEPHGPYRPPEAFSAMFAEDELEESDNRTAPLSYKPLPGATPNKVLGAIPLYQQIEDEDQLGVYIREYDAEIRYMDTAFSRIISFLKQSGLYDQSIVIFAADHGESLGEHDYYFEHGWFAYDASLRIPLLIKEPHQTDGRTVAEQVSLLDFLPTVLALARVETEQAEDGTNILAPLNGDRAVIVENSDRYPERYIGLRTRSMKYLRVESTGNEELYNLIDDPGEATNRVDVDNQALKVARERTAGLLERYHARHSHTAAKPETHELKHLEELRSLGYVR